MSDTTHRVLTLARDLGILRPRDLAARGLPRRYAGQLAARGALTRIGRGLYTLPGGVVSAHHSLAEVAAAAPRGVICLLSALRFHGLTTQNPPDVWLAIEGKAWRPRSAPFPIEVVYLTGPAFTEGVETHVIDGVPTRIYSSAKTVADCFKFRNRIGPDVAVEALRDYLRRYRGGADELWRFARICRVSRVMLPYLDALL